MVDEVFNMTKATLASIYALIILLSSCGYNSTYEKTNAGWSYISYDEGAGKRTIDLNVDNKTFITIDDDYAKDKDKVFYQGRHIELALPQSFQVLTEGYSKDIENVYLFNYPIINANPDAFAVLGGLFSKDNENIYCGTIPFLSGEISSFEILEKNPSKTVIKTSEFLKKNPQYSFIDESKYKVVVYSNSISSLHGKRYKGISELATDQ